MSAFFSGSETAFFALNRIHLERLKNDSPPLFKTVFSLLKHPEKLIITILIGNEIVNLTFSVVVASLLIKYFGEAGKYSAIFVTTFALLFFGEITPKIVAVKSPLMWAKMVAGPMSLLYIIFAPARICLNLIVNIFKESGSDIYKKTIMSEDEFKALIELGTNEGELDKDENEMIQKVFEFEEIPVSKVMTPRTDIFCMNLDSGLREILDKLKEYRFSRIPVYDDNIDSIVGILYAKKLLHYIDKRDKEKSGNKNFDLKSILQPPILVPGTKKLDELLSEFRKRKIHMAVVIDEYGGVEGIVTMEDLLEELFGEIHDEFDIEKEPIRKISDTCFRVSGMLSIENFNEAIGTKVSEEAIDTIGGYVFHLFGKVPKKGESVRADELNFVVEKIKGARIMEVKVDRLLQN